MIRITGGYSEIEQRLLKILQDCDNDVELFIDQLSEILDCEESEQKRIIREKDGQITNLARQLDEERRYSAKLTERLKDIQNTAWY